MKKFITAIALYTIVVPTIASGADAPLKQKSDDIIVTTTLETIR